jgi:hypothetical protein
MARKFRPRVVLVAIESVYGTDEVPTAGSNAVETVEAEIEPLAAEEVEHMVDRESLGNYLSTLVGKHVIARFKVAVAGSGTPETPTGYGPLLQICGLSETIDAGVGTEKVTYAPITAGEESASVYFHVDGALHALLGCRGRVSLDLQPKQLLYWQFEIWGLYVGPTTAALPSPTLTAFQKPIPVSNNNTSFALHGINPVLVAMAFDTAGELLHRDVPGEESIQITNRKPGGSVTIDAPDLATKDYFASVEASTTGVLTLTHGTADGNIVEISGPKVQLSSIAHANNDGILGYQMNTRFIPDAGNDEYAIVTK